MLADTVGTHPGLDLNIEHLTQALRGVYLEAFWPAHGAASDTAELLETVNWPDTIDPDLAGDIAGCQAINHHLAQLVGKYLSGATLIERQDEPTIVHSTWRIAGHVIEITWTGTHDIGGPQSITINHLNDRDVA